MVDLVVILVLVAVAAWWHQARRGPGEPEPTVAVSSPSPSGPAEGPDGRTAPPFTLNDADGRPHSYDGKGGLFIVLTAIGCGDCLSRIEAQDRKAAEMARARGLPVWNLLVFADESAGRTFMTGHQPDADRVLVDPGGKVSVDVYRGSDAACWILVRGGRIVWQGGADLEALGKAL